MLDGYLAWKNCTTWRQKHWDGVHGYNWESWDEKKCDKIHDFMYDGPEGDQEGDNADAAEEIKETNWQTKQSLCKFTIRKAHEIV